MAKIEKTPSILVRMYRLGTGDFFLLKIKNGQSEFKILLDCGCIDASEADFEPFIHTLKADTGGVIDLLIVTHEHDDHINGFIRAKSIFREFSEVKRAWFAWTERKDDELANDLRDNHTAKKMMLQNAVAALDKLESTKYFTSLFEGTLNANTKNEIKDNYLDSMRFLKTLNQPFDKMPAGPIPTMEDRLRDLGVIRPKTEVEFLKPGEVKDIPGLDGIRFLVLGPPRDLKKLSKTEQKGRGYIKRVSTNHDGDDDQGFLEILAAMDENGKTMASTLPFDSTKVGSVEESKFFKSKYHSEPWRKIDHDWLNAASDLALRLETSINNTSLAFGIQFVDSERILLFPGDAEFGNWESWHDEGLSWEIKKGSKTQTVDVKYILRNTVFYKVGHHLSHNGTGKENGLDLMTNPNLAAMATLHLGEKKIRSRWRNTMPNDQLGLDLLKKTKGKLYFLGDRKEILKKIPIEKLEDGPAILKVLEKLNVAFDGKDFVEIEIKGK